MTSATRYVTSASRYQSRSSMYIRGLIPRNFTELADAVQIAFRQDVARTGNVIIRKQNLHNRNLFKPKPLKTVIEIIFTFSKQAFNESLEFFNRS